VPLARSSRLIQTLYHDPWCGFSDCTSSKIRIRSLPRPEVGGAQYLDHPVSNMLPRLGKDQRTAPTLPRIARFDPRGGSNLCWAWKDRGRSTGGRCTGWEHPSRLTRPGRQPKWPRIPLRRDCSERPALPRGSAVRQFPGRVAQAKERRAVILFQDMVIGGYPQLAQSVFESGLHTLTPPRTGKWRIKNS
jgi:hypothetical protein